MLRGGTECSGRWGPCASAGSCCSLPAGLGELSGGVPGMEFESSFCAVFADEDERSTGVTRIALTRSHPRPCEPAGSCRRSGLGSAWRCPGQERRHRVQPAARRLPLAPSSTSGLGGCWSPGTGTRGWGSPPEGSPNPPGSEAGGPVRMPGAPSLSQAAVLC